VVVAHGSPGDEVVVLVDLAVDLERLELTSQCIIVAWQCKCDIDLNELPRSPNAQHVSKSQHLLL
jgi:hypothetical protein